MPNVPTAGGRERERIMNREEREQAMAREALERHRRIEFERTTSARLDRMESEMERLHRETRAVVEEALRRLEAQNGSIESREMC